MNKEKTLQRRRQRRRNSVRRTLRGSADMPRMTVFRSLKHISCQLVDDVAGKTLLSASTRDKTLRGEIGYGGNKAAAVVIGKRIAEKALAAGIKAVKFDRGHNRYHGRVAALADAAREGGLKF